MAYQTSVYILPCFWQAHWSNSCFYFALFLTGPLQSSLGNIGTHICGALYGFANFHIFCNNRYPTGTNPKRIIFILLYLSIFSFSNWIINRHTIHHFSFQPRLQILFQSSNYEFMFLWLLLWIQQLQFHHFGVFNYNQSFSWIKSLLKLLPLHLILSIVIFPSIDSVLIRYIVGECPLLSLKSYSSSL